MIPLVGEKKELKFVKDVVIEEAEAVKKEKNSDIRYKIGTMIEIPRAALLANEIAEEAEFFSFGTNDLTQMTFGFSFSDNAVRADYSLNFDFDYRYYFDANYRFGFFGGLSLGIGNFKEVVTYDEETEPFPGKFVWDARVGLTVRI